MSSDLKNHADSLKTGPGGPADNQASNYYFVPRESSFKDRPTCRLIFIYLKCSETLYTCEVVLKTAQGELGNRGESLGIIGKSGENGVKLGKKEFPNEEINFPRL